MSESNEIEKEFEEVELNDDWEDAFKVGHFCLRSFECCTLF